VAHFLLAVEVGLVGLLLGRLVVMVVWDLFISRRLLRQWTLPLHRGAGLASTAI